MRQRAASSTGATPKQWPHADRDHRGQQDLREQLSLDERYELALPQILGRGSASSNSNGSRRRARRLTERARRRAHRPARRAPSGRRRGRIRPPWRAVEAAEGDVPCLVSFLGDRVYDPSSGQKTGDAEVATARQARRTRCPQRNRRSRPRKRGRGRVHRPSRSRRRRPRAESKERRTPSARGWPAPRPG